jgi:hypothetical protein
MELGNDIIGHKRNLSGPTDKLVLSGAGLRRDKREDRSAVRRRDGYPAFAGLETGVIDQTESELIEVEPQTSILITNKDFNRVKAEVRVLSIGIGS